MVGNGDLNADNFKNSSTFSDENTQSDVTLIDIGSDPRFRAILWTCFIVINLIFLLMWVFAKCACKKASPRVAIILRNLAAAFYVVSSIILVAFLGVDEGPAHYTTSKQDCWNLLVAIGLYMCNGFWAWICLLKYVATSTKIKVRWRNMRGRQMLHTVQTELEAFHAAAPPPVQPQALIPAPAVDGADNIGPLGKAYIQAIRAGKADEISGLGAMGTFLGPNQLLAHAPPTTTGFVAAVQDGLYQAQGGGNDDDVRKGSGFWNTGGLALDDQEKLWNWAVALMAVCQTIHYGVFAYLSYLDVMRASN
jgi:hypothetical protein